MDLHTYTTMRDWRRQADVDAGPAQDIEQYYERTLKDAVGMGSAPRKKWA